MITVLADVQLHAYANFARITPSGRNSRLQNGVDAIKFAVDAADGGYLIILGDLFEDRRSLTIDVMNAALESIEYASSRLKGVYMVVGNHDQYYRDGSIHSLRAFSHMSGVEVVSSFHTAQMDGTEVFMAAFHEDPSVVKKWIATRAPSAFSPTLLCVHQAVFGAEADGGFLYNAGDALTVQDLRPSAFDHVLIGHFHSPQTLSENVHYVGSPYQIKANEIDQVKRIAAIDGGARLTWLPVPGMPTFRRISAADFELLTSDDIQAHFWLVTGTLGYQLPNVRVLPEPKEAASYASACSSLDGAVREWLTAHNRPDLIERAVGMI